MYYQLIHDYRNKKTRVKYTFKQTGLNRQTIQLLYVLHLPVSCWIARRVYNIVLLNFRTLITCRLNPFAGGWVCSLIRVREVQKQKELKGVTACSFYPSYLPKIPNLISENHPSSRWKDYFCCFCFLTSLFCFEFTAAAVFTTTPRKCFRRYRRGI